MVLFADVVLCMRFVTWLREAKETSSSTEACDLHLLMMGFMR